MLHAHRDFNEQKIIIHESSTEVKLTLTTEEGFEISNRWSGVTTPTLAWSIGEHAPTPVKLTSITGLRKYFNYSEPSYSSHIKKWLNVHPNQYQAAKEVVEYFLCGINNVILTAEMQSGKSGTARYVVHSLLHHSGPSTEWEARMVPDRMYFICGMNDNDLRRQAIKEFAGLIPEKNILFSKQLQRSQAPSRDAPSLVIVDESHYASNVNSLVDKFMKSVDSSSLILSVSATAMAELATSQSMGKAMVYLKPGDNYYSIRDIFRRGLVHQAVNITTKQREFIDLVTEEYEHQKDHNELKYNIVRIPSQWYYQDLEDDIKSLGLNIDFINHHTSSALTSPSSLSSSISEDEFSGTCSSPSPLTQKADDFNDYINDEPPRFTIIWIYGSLRAGKQLNTTHIGFVHDTAESAPDTIAQSLLGRILGYNKRNNHVKCFTDVKSAKLMCTWMSNVYDITKIPSGSRGIINGYTDNIKKWQLHPPMAVMLDTNTRSYFRALKQKHSNRYPYKQDFIDAVIQAADGISKSEIEHIFETHEPGRCGGLMILIETNAYRTFNDYWDYNYRSWLSQTPVRGFDVVAPGKYYYLYANLNINSPEYGVVLITRKEYLNSKPEVGYVRVKQSSRFTAIKLS
jgi:hypothetical protein